MIRSRFHIDKYGWTVTVFYAVTGIYVDDILPELEDIGCRGETLREAEAVVSSSRLDTGLTYSNNSLRRTVIVIAKTSSPKEFAKSWRHEMGHLADHIAMTFGIDPHGEEIQYIGDEIVEQMWLVARDFLCEDCRDHRLRRHVK